MYNFYHRQGEHRGMGVSNHAWRSQGQESEPHHFHIMFHSQIIVKRREVLNDCKFDISLLQGLVIVNIYSM